MALDAEVGWLWYITQPDGEYVQYHGPEVQAQAIAEHTRLLDVVADALERAGLSRHREPRWPDVLPREPEGARMGFYGSNKYGGLDDLLSHIWTHKRAPVTRADLDQSASYEAGRRTYAPAEARGVTGSGAFDHLYFCMARMSCIYVPVDFVPVIEIEPPPGVELWRIGSAPELMRECQTLLTIYDWLAETSRDYNWLLAYGEHADFPGLCRVQGRSEFDEEIDLAFRLMRVAQEAVALGASITFS